MTLKELQQLYAAHPRVAALSRLIGQGQARHLHAAGLTGSAASLACAALMEGSDCPLVVILGDVEEAGYFYHDLCQIFQGEAQDRVLFFPSSFRRAVKFGRYDAASVILRTEVLGRLHDRPQGLCVVTYADAVAERVVSPQELQTNTLTLHQGERVDMDFVVDMLSSYGFERVDYVYEPGQYAIRGSLVDVFSFACEYPYRIDFFGDEVDSLRTFEVETQLSRDRHERIVIVPDLLSKDGGQRQAGGKPRAVADEDEGQLVPLLDFLPRDTVLVVRDLLYLRDRIQTVADDALSPQAEAARATGEGDVVALDRLLLDGEDFLRQALDLRRLELSPRPMGVPDGDVSLDTAPQPIYHKNFDLVASSFTQYLAEGYTIYICSDSRKQTDRLADIFRDRGDKIRFTAVDHTLHEGFLDHTLRLCVFTDHQIFDRYHKYTLRSDRARSGKVALSLKELNQFNPGDYVVHTDHGVGRFAGLVRIPQGDRTQEVIKLVYANDDVVFVSIHSLHKVSKYKGKEGEPPRLNRLGTGAWEKMKNRTKARVKDIARDLIQLYARRMGEQGFAFSPDTFMQQELEASFLYEDTPDQARATAAVKADMEASRPMDRLVCGDVGFGKTEVAIRAAFKAVADDKQVAVLVPTTVLAYQHYRTFTERLRQMPCRVEYLSRARTAGQAKATLRDLSEGRINILIGTHRILGKDVRFKDLGLLIIDEEQKFGVSVKEKLRQMRVNVDTLTLTATPIPRTLQFSLMGARDLSVIQTPPPNRYPIQTEVHVFNEEIIADAIRFEMGRNGQVFFVNNRISNLESLRDLILRHVPDCRVAIGHGRMDPQELERVVLAFADYDYDVLLATTIVENGVDIPNANTILINDAHCFGLSDLHQMRGRVGRSNRRAFCYLLAPPLSTLPTDARRRLQAIENFSGLGSGIHIAMQDLDIRGAGNLLGAEQSGFIADVGYETYQKILAEAVHELRVEEFAYLGGQGLADKGAGAGQGMAGVHGPGERPQSVGKAAGQGMPESATGVRAGQSSPTSAPAYILPADFQWVDDCTVESDLELLLPATYVAGSAERMTLYRELDSLTRQEDVEAFRLRLEDRFGPVPHEAEQLLQVVPLRRRAARLGVERVSLKQGRMTLQFVSRMDSPYYQSEAFGQVIDYAMRQPRRCELREQAGRRSLLVRNVRTVSEGIQVLDAIGGKDII